MDSVGAKRVQAATQQILGSPSPAASGPRMCDWAGERGGCGRFGAQGSGRPAARIVAGKWHLCSACAALEKFRGHDQTDLERQRVRVAGRTCLQCEHFNLAFDPEADPDAGESLLVLECGQSHFASRNNQPLALDSLRIIISMGEDCPHFKPGVRRLR